MRLAWAGALVVAAAAIAAAQPWYGVLHQHPAIAYASRQTTDRAGALGRAVADGTRTLARDPSSGYLRSLLDALGVATESQLLVFSRTGVQREHTSPHSPRSLFFNRSVVVGYIPGAPVIEIAS